MRCTILLLPLSFLLCCSSGELSVNKSAQNFSDFNKNHSVTFKYLNDREWELDIPQNIIAKDSFLILISRVTSNHWINIYSINQNKVIKSFLKRGRGPEEVLAIQNSGIYRDSLWLYDIASKKILKINTFDLLSNESPAINSYKINEFFYSASLLNDSLLVLSGDETTKEKFKIVNIYTSKVMDKQQAKNVYDFPKKFPTPVAKDALRSYVNTRSGVNLKIALIYRYTDVVEFFDSDLNLTIALHGPDRFTPQFQIGSRDGRYFMKKTPKSKKAYVTSIATDSHLYALYSGALRASGDWSFGKQIHVFDWNGNREASYHLNTKVYCIGIDKKKSRIYSFSEEENKIVYFEL